MAREPREDRSETREEGGRRQRIPLGAPTLKLEAATRPGFVRRWVNDDGEGRLQKAERGDYAFVQSKDGEHETRLVGTTKQGQPMTAHLMEIREDFYAEDQALKRAENAKVDAAIKGDRKARAANLNGEDPSQFYGTGTISRS